MSCSKSVLLASAAAVQLLVVAPAFAQDSEAAAADANNTDVITVTAFKREQNIQDVPAAIAALSGEALTARGISEPADLQFVTPSLQVGESQGNTAFTIRGVGFNTVGLPAHKLPMSGCSAKETG